MVEEIVKAQKQAKMDDREGGKKIEVGIGENNSHTKKKEIEPASLSRRGYRIFFFFVFILVVNIWSFSLTKADWTPNPDEKQEIVN